MATRSRKNSSPSGRIAPIKENVGTVLSTFAGPSTTAMAQSDVDQLDTRAQQRLATQKIGAQAASAAMPANPLKAGEHGLDRGHQPMPGKPVEPHDPIDAASTVSEDATSPKVGDGKPVPGHNPGNESLDRARVDSSGQVLTTNMGVAVADNQNSLKAGLRGPTLMEDFILREKITHFDHERIPERIVHARGSAAHGYFESYQDLSPITRAAPFAAAGKRTPVFVRFSTVAGERGSFDLARDVRGFAVKFYTDEGNWDIVGNNIPVFFIQDAMKFPDLVHAVKPEPHNAMPQAASAHDTFWDFVSLMPESTHMLMWVMSDRAIPRSYRMMQGFGVHTFRLVNAAGESRFCKFHWEPVAGTHSVVWDEAVKINGADPDFHRRDLWEAIEAGAYPGVGARPAGLHRGGGRPLQLRCPRRDQDRPRGAGAGEEGRPDGARPQPGQLLRRDRAGRVRDDEHDPGIDTSNDPLLQGRHHSYFDTQLSRLGGPNFHEIPINSSVAQVHNNQRDGLHRQAIPRGRVAYEPNSLGGGCPFQAGMRGFVAFPQPVFEDKVRGKPEKFADHFTQARLFFESQTETEKNHIVGAFRFELTKVGVEAIRERVISMLANVSAELAQGVAEGLGIAVPAPQPRVLENPADARGDDVAGAVADGATGRRQRQDAPRRAPRRRRHRWRSLRAVHAALAAAGAVPRFVGARLGVVRPASGDPIHVEVTMETAPAVLWDGVVVPAGDAGLAALGQAVDFVKDQYRHCKTILVLGAESALVERAMLPAKLPDGSDDPGLVMARSGDAASAFIAALARHRHYERETDPPRI